MTIHHDIIIPHPPRPDALSEAHAEGIANDTTRATPAPLWVDLALVAMAAFGAALLIAAIFIGYPLLLGLLDMTTTRPAACVGLTAAECGVAL